VPKSPNFIPTKSKPLERSYVNEGKPPTGPGGLVAQSALAQATGGDKLKATLAAKSAKSRAGSSTGAPVKQPSSNRATALLQQKRREEMEAANAEKERKAKEDADRIARQN
jgi:hypothetical protein